MTAEWNALALVGIVARPHGLRGELVVNPQTDFADLRFRPGAVLCARQGDAVLRYTVTSVRFQDGRPIVTLAGVDTVEAAERLRALELRVPVENLAPLPDGTFYRHDLIGCIVSTVSGEMVGAVVGVEGSLGDSRLVVAGVRGEVLIPLAAAICVRIDPGARSIEIDPPDGLLELNAAR